MNIFDHKNLGNHLLQLCPKVVKHPVYSQENTAFNEAFNTNTCIRTFTCACFTLILFHTHTHTHTHTERFFFNIWTPFFKVLVLSSYPRRFVRYEDPKSVVSIAHRKGDDRYQKCDSCACAKFRGDRRVATTHPVSIRTVHSLATRYSKWLMFSGCE